MDSVVFPLLTVLTLISLMLAGVFVMAWRTMGRPRHALTWATTFLCGAAAWGLNLADGLLIDGGALYWTLTSVPLLAMMMLAVVGYRQRAGMPARWRVLAAVALAVVVATYATRAWWPHRGINMMLLPLCATAMFPVGIAALIMRPGPRTPAELASVGLLTMFTVFEAAVTLLAFNVGPGPGNGAAVDRYDMALFSGLPSLYIALGTAGLFLLMADQTRVLDSLARSDGLTSLLNRTGFREAAEQRIAAAESAGTGCCIVIGDIDHFKRINDNWGHAAGDAAIRAVAGVLRGSVRAGDIVGRIGGEEFAILLPQVDPAHAADLIERLRRRIAAVRLPAYPDVRITMSFGITGTVGHALGLDEALRRADGALYRAKSDGRDRIRIAA